MKTRILIQSSRYSCVFLFLLFCAMGMLSRSSCVAGGSTTVTVNVVGTGPCGSQILYWVRWRYDLPGWGISDEFPPFGSYSASGSYSAPYPGEVFGELRVYDVVRQQEFIIPAATYGTTITLFSDCNGLTGVQGSTPGVDDNSDLSPGGIPMGPPKIIVPDLGTLDPSLPPPNLGPDGSSPPDNNPCGMPRWRVSEPNISLWVDDEPLGYQPALGPRISFSMAYKQRESTAGYNPNFFSIGKRWNFAWFSYVEQDWNTNNIVHLPDGGQRTYVGTNLDYLTGTHMSGDTTNGYTVYYPDGSQDVYGFVVTNSSGNFLEAFMTQRWNKVGQKTRFDYYSYTPSAPVIRLKDVVDGDGRTNLIYYIASNGYSTNLISSVVDPFGRSNSLAYDSTGLLTNSVDVAGLSSSFAYTNPCCWLPNWLVGMTTPYGTTSFQLTDTAYDDTAPNGRSVLITEPDGSLQLYLFQDSATGVAGTYVTNAVPTTASYTNSFDNTNLDLHNSFHWGRRQYQALSTTTISSFTTNDFRKARMQHWLLTGTNTISQTLSMTREASPDTNGSIAGQMTWYDYAGKTNVEYTGTQMLPLFTARVLPNGTTAFERDDRNLLGNTLTNITTYTSAGSIALRTNVLIYDSSVGVDLITFTNALGVQVSSNVYNNYHQVLTNRDALNQATVYTYNGNQQLISIVFPSGLVSTNIYETDNWQATNYAYAVTGFGTVYFGTNTYTYTNDLVYTHTDARGLATTNTWDNLQRLLRVDFPDTTFVTNTYSNLDLIRVVDRMGFTNSFGYDSMRRKIAETNAIGVVNLYNYCTCGSLAIITNGLGTSAQAVTQFYYDNQGKLTNAVYPDGYSVTNCYNLVRQLTNTVDSGGVSVTNWFNNQGIEYAISNYFGQVSLLTFDILDRVTNSVDANGVVITSSYDYLNRVLLQVYPDTGTNQFYYTTNGLVAYTNQLGKVTLYDYDAAGRKTIETNANLETNYFTYGPAGDLLSLTDGKGQLTTWHHDIYGDVTNKVDNNGTEILRYFYDADRRLTNRWSITKTNTYYYYDKAGNLTNVIYPVNTAISLAYDALNRLTNMIDAVGTTKYSYDPVGQLLSEDGPWNDDTVSYTYANRLRSSLSLQEQNADSWWQTYAYDGARRLTNSASPAGNFAYSYDPTCNLLVKKLLLPNTAYITNDYDSNARLLDTWLRNSGNTNLNRHSYAYNVGNQKTNQTFIKTNYQNYLYDNIGQLTNCSGKEYGGTTNRLQEQLAYGYDAAHNLSARTNNALVQTFNVNGLNELTTITRSGTLTVSGTTSSNATSVTVNSSAATPYSDYTFAKAGLSLSDGNNTFTAVASDGLGRSDTDAITVDLPATVTYAYDSNGNLTSDGTRGFSYDDENQLVRVTVTNSWKTEFTYDGKMRLRIRKDYAYNGSSYVVTDEVHYIYDGNLAIQERSSINLPITSYTRGNDPSGSLEGAGGVGGMLARTDHTQVSPSHAYYHGDGNGNITALIGSQQFVTARYEYDPYGNILSQSGPLADSNTYRFASKEYIKNAGVTYFVRRFYESSLQRWLNRDPIGEQGGLNLYAYVVCNPINKIDPIGLFDAGKIFWGSVQVVSGVLATVAVGLAEAPSGGTVSVAVPTIFTAITHGMYEVGLGLQPTPTTEEQQKVLDIMPSNPGQLIALPSYVFGQDVGQKTETILGFGWDLVGFGNSTVDALNSFAKGEKMVLPLAQVGTDGLGLLDSGMDTAELFGTDPKQSIFPSLIDPDLLLSSPSQMQLFLGAIPPIPNNIFGAIQPSDPCNQSK